MRFSGIATEILNLVKSERSIYLNNSYTGKIFEINAETVEQLWQSDAWGHLPSLIDGYLFFQTCGRIPNISFYLSIIEEKNKKNIIEYPIKGPFTSYPLKAGNRVYFVAKNKFFYDTEFSKLIGHFSSDLPSIELSVDITSQIHEYKSSPIFITENQFLSKYSDGKVINLFKHNKKINYLLGIDGTSAFLLDEEDKLINFDILSGKIKWEFSQVNLLSVITESISNFIYWDRKNHLLFLDSTSGQIYNKITIDHHICCTIPVVRDDIVYFVEDYSKLVAFNTATSKEEWVYNVNEHILSLNVKDGFIYIGTKKSEIFGLKIDEK